MTTKNHQDEGAAAKAAGNAGATTASKPDPRVEDPYEKDAELPDVAEPHRTERTKRDTVIDAPRENADFVAEADTGADADAGTDADAGAAAAAAAGADAADAGADGDHETDPTPRH